MSGFYQKHRPNTLDEMVGQAAALKTVRGFRGNLPPAVLVHGPSGVGKTTLLRVLAREIGVPPENTFDYSETNCGECDPMQTVRDIKNGMRAASMGGNGRVYVLDEVQALSRATFAQQGLLKILEDPPPRVFFMLATTDPQKVLPTIRNRCTQIRLTTLSAADLKELVTRVAAAEKAKVDGRVVDKIVEAAAGSARAALVELEKVIGLAPEDRLDAFGPVGAEKAAFDLVKVLIPFKGQPNWSDVAKVLESLEGEDPESLRQLLLGSARKVLLRDGGTKQGPLAFKIIDILSGPFLDRNSGSAQIVAMCYLVVFGK